MIIIAVYSHFIAIIMFMLPKRMRSNCNFRVRSEIQGNFPDGKVC